MIRLLRLLTTPTPHIVAQHFRIYILLAVGTAAAIAVHSLYTALFWIYGVGEMVVLNVAFSLPVYVVAMLANRKGWHVAAVVLAVAELCVHQALTVMNIGWDAGLQYYLLVVPAVAFSLPGRKLVVKCASVAAAAGTFLLLLAWSSKIEPGHVIEPTALLVANYVNIATVFGLLGFFAMHYAGAAELAEGRLTEQYLRAENLLHNILPVPIAERLKAGSGTIADGFSDASVLFADIVGFTRLSAQVPPDKLVSMLNAVFSEFDMLVEGRGLEKIKTIGDAYMVASGIPAPRADHAQALVELALDMSGALARKAMELGIPLQMRVGINSGPVVAGVIGKRKFIYDLWGDAVNTASRMESHGVPGRIQVSEATMKRLEHLYLFESRGEIQVKGMGALNVYLLAGRIPPIPRAPGPAPG